MTRRTTVRVRCDRCPTIRQGHYNETAASLRTRLRDVGWDNDDPSGTDLCPTCVAKLARRGAVQ